MTSNEKPVRDNNGRFIKWHKPLYVPKYFCRKGYIPPTAFKKGSKAPETAFKKGQIPWNKGLTRAEDKRISGSWNKGLTCKTDERLKEMGKSLVIAHKKGKFGPNTGFQKKDKHYNWNGGNKAYWRKKAREKAEKILGKTLKSNVIIHHIDRNPYNLANNNLLICARDYHAWLHNKLNNVYGKDWENIFRIEDVNDK